MLLSLFLMVADPSYLELTPTVRLPLIRVDAGSFMQGSPANEKGREADEVVREVRLSQPFYMGKTMVTRAMFGAFVEATGYRTEAEKGTSGGFGIENNKLVQRPKYNWRTPSVAMHVIDDSDPVVIVTYNDALAFTVWASEVSGRTVRLPSEAEFELAAKLKVGQLDGLLGRYEQWCLDWYAPWTDAEVTDPRGPNEGQKRVLRGGSFLRDKRRARASARTQQSPGSRNADISFRVVVEEGPARPRVTTAGVKELGVATQVAPKADDGGWGSAKVFAAVASIVFLPVILLVWLVRRAKKHKASGPAAGQVHPNLRIQGEMLVVSGIALGKRVRVSYLGKNGKRTKRLIHVHSDPTTVLLGSGVTALTLVEILDAVPRGGASAGGDLGDDYLDDDSLDHDFDTQNDSGADESIEDRGSRESVSSGSVVAASTWTSPRAY